MSRRRVAPGLLAGALCLPFLVAESPAVTPLTPRLDDTTRFALLAGLTDTGMPEVGQNSVVIAIAAVLGFEPADGRYDAPSTYPHLPSVTAVGAKGQGVCVQVEARADGAAARGYRAVVVTGRYCQVGPALWASDDQRVVAGTPGSPAPAGR